MRTPEREQRLIELLFGFDDEPPSLSTVGRKLGITRERARQLEREALAKLERALATAILGESTEVGIIAILSRRRGRREYLTIDDPFPGTCTTARAGSPRNRPRGRGSLGCASSPAGQAII